MKKVLSVILILLSVSLVFAGCSKETGQKEGFNYYTQEELKEAIESNEDILIVDIQVEEDFDKHHIKGAIETNAYPVKEDTDKAKLDNIMKDLEASDNPIIIVCPRGGGGAERTYNYLKEKDISEDRLYILENGQAGWSYDELLAE
ncbi:rhodanese-like domain-containing protein [Dethiothermospora halolimnae]|uniref:rhodanese-like domain-containing protein n=1 Tax=Dethiothermospora halolimnae TaxID=3114390 RepID=UPI003CCBF668